MSNLANQAVVTVTAYPTVAQFPIGFQPHSIDVRVAAVSGAGTVIAFSFDGINDHGFVDVGGFPAFFPRIMRQSIWFRVATAPGAGSAIWRAMAWTV